MSPKMRRRIRHDRLKRVVIERRHRREDALFYATGRVPASARMASICCCGASAFSRDAHDDLDDFNLCHEYCEVEL